MESDRLENTRVCVCICAGREKARVQFRPFGRRDIDVIHSQAFRALSP